MTVLKTASMYLRAAKTDAEAAGEATDGMASSVSKLRGEILTITKGQVDIMADETTFKSTVQIYRELADVWNELADIDQANILELIGGKRNATANAALLQNFQEVEKAIETASNSSGSALAENEKQLASIEGRLSLFKAAFQGLSAAMFPTDSLKGFVDAGTGLLNFLGSAVGLLGGFGNALKVIGLIIATLKFEKTVAGITILFNTFKRFPQFIAKFATPVKTLISGFKNIGMAMEAASRTGQSFGEVMAKLGTSIPSMVTSGLMIATAIATVIGAIITAQQQHEAEMRQAAISRGEEASQSAQAIMEAYSKYQDADEAYASNTGTKEALTSATNELLTALGMEGTAIGTLIGQYGSLNDAMQVKTIDALREKMSDISTGLEASREELKVKASDYWSDYSHLSMGIPNWTNQQEVDLWNVAARRLESAGYKIDTVDTGGEQYLTYPFINNYKDAVELIKTMEAQKKVLEQGVAEGDYTRNQLDSLKVYQNLGQRISALSGYYDDAIKKEREFNDVAAQIKWQELDDNVKLPKTQAEFNSLRQNLIDTAKASDEFIGGEEDIEQAIDRLLSKQDNLSDFISQSTLVSKSINEADVLQGLKDRYTDNVKAIKEEFNALYKDLEGDDVWQNYNPFFGNIDLNDRQVLQWTDDNLNKYKDALMSWARDGQSWEDVRKEFEGSLSTVMGSSGEYDGIEIAFSPMLQTENGAELLSSSTVDKYITSLIDKAGEGWTNEQLLQLDAEGLEIEGQYIKNLIADIGDTAAKTGEIMHYIGANGAIKQAEQEAKAFSDWIDKLNTADKNLVYEIALTNDTNDWDLQAWNKELENLKGNTEALDILHAKVAAIKDTELGTLDFDISTETESVEKFTTALKESVSAAGLTQESIASITERYGALSNFDASSLFEKTYNGIHLNVQALRELESEYQKTKRAYLDTALTKQVDKYNELAKTIDRVADIRNKDFNISQAASLTAEQAALALQIEQTAQLASQYEGLTSAYQNWLDAQSATEEGDMYDNIAGKLEDIGELYKNGLIGTDKFRTAVQMMTNFDVSDWSPEDLMKAYQNGYPLMVRYFTDGQEGCQRFLQDVSKLNSEWAHLNEDGKWEFNFGEGNDTEIADKLGISVDAVQAIIRKLSDYGFTINLDSAFSNIDLLKDKLSDANKHLIELGKTNVNFKINTDSIKSLNEQITEGKKILDQYKDSDGKFNFEADGLNDIIVLLEALIARRNELNAPAIVKVDTSGVSETSDDLMQAVQNMQQFVSAYNTLSALKELGLDTSDAESNLQTVFATIQNTNPEILVKFGLSPESMTPEGLMETLQNTTPEMIVTMGVDSQLVADYQESDKDSKGTVFWNNNTVAVDLYKMIPKVANGTVYWTNTETNSRPTGGSTGNSPARGTAFARGSWGTRGSGIALGGELGQELVVRDGKFFTIGDNSAELFRYKKGDIIFNAEQTKQIFEKGKITWGNRRGVRAMAEGTAFSNGSGGFYQSGVIQKTVKSNNSGKNTTSDKSSSSSKSSSKDMEDELKKMQEAIKETIAIIEHQIFLTGKLAEPDYPDPNAIIDLYTKAMDEVHKQAEAYRAKGQDENSEYIREMQEQWWKFHDEIAKTINDAYERVRNKIENNIELTKTAVERNYLFGDFDSAKNNVNQMLGLYDELKESYHEQAEYLRSLGYTNDSDEVSELMQNWAEAEQDAIDAITDAFEKQRKHTANAIDLNTIWQSKAINDNDYKAVKAYTDKIVAYQKQQQETLHAQAEYYRSLGYSDTSDEVKELMEAWNECQEAIVKSAEDAYKALVDYANEAVDKIQDLYSKLKDAAKEFAESGYVTVDAFQAIIELGVEYMNYLKDENGLLVINRDRINQMIAARTEQLAVTTALNYVEQLRTALTTNNTRELERLLDATKETSTATWDLVYANLRLLGLDEIQYKQALDNINKLRSLYDSVAQGIGHGAEDGSSKYGDMKDALDDILDLVMELIKYESEQRVKALEEQIDKYKEIIDLKKESLKATKEENDYNKQLTSKVKQMAELQERIARLSLDDSREAQAERISLEKELAELQEDTADYQADYAYDRTVDMLDDEYDAYEKAKQKQIEREKETVSSTQKVYELAIQRIEEEWDTLFDDIIAWNYEAGSRIESEIIDKWKLAIEAVKEYGSFVEAVNHFNEVDSKSNSDDYDVVGNYTEHQGSGNYGKDKDTIEKMKRNSIAYAVAGATGDETTQKRLFQQNQSYAQQLSFKTNFGNDGVWYDTQSNSALYRITTSEIVAEVVKKMKANSSEWATASANKRIFLDAQNQTLGRYIRRITGEEVYRDNDGVWWIGNSHLYDKYHTGGVVGHNGTTKDNEILALLEKGEVVLNDSKKNGLYRVMDIASYMIEKFGAKLDGISGLGSIANKPIANTIGELRDKALGSLGNITDKDITYTIESVEVNAPVQVLEKLDESAIREHARTIGTIAEKCIREGFTKRGVSSPTSLF